MANNNSYDIFYSENKRLLNETETNLECSVNLESDEQVTKVLAVDVSGNIQNTECLQGEANVNGLLFISVVFATESGLVGNTSYIAPFVSKISDSSLKPDSKIFAKVNSCDVEVSSINSNIAKIECNVKVKAYCYHNEEVSFLSETGEDVCFKQDNVEYYTYNNSQTGEWTESLEALIKEPVQKVLSSTSAVNLKSAECGAGFVSLNCEVVNKLTYLSMEENSQIKTVYTKQDVKQEVECQNVTSDSKVEVDLYIAKQNEKTEVEDKDSEVKVCTFVPLVACLHVFDKNSVNVITDLYSTTNYTLVSTSSYNSTQVCSPIIFEKKVEGSLTLSEEEPRIDKLLAVNYSKVIVTNEFLSNGEYSLSGVVTSNLIYFNEDDSVPCSVDVEIPFVVTTQTELEGEYLLDLNVSVKDVDVMVKKGRDVFVDATVCVYTNVCKESSSAVISELEYKEELPNKDCAIEIYFAKAGEKVWDIAKGLNIKPEKIYAQNPDISEILESDQKLAIYYQKNQK